MSNDKPIPCRRQWIRNLFITLTLSEQESKKNLLLVRSLQACKISKQLIELIVRESDGVHAAVKHFLGRAF